MRKKERKNGSTQKPTGDYRKIPFRLLLCCKRTVSTKDIKILKMWQYTYGSSEMKLHPRYIPTSENSAYLFLFLFSRLFLSSVWMCQKSFLLPYRLKDQVEKYIYILTKEDSRNNCNSNNNPQYQFTCRKDTAIVDGD